MNNSQIVEALSKLRTSSTFLSLKGYRNEANEVADYNIVFHISYKAALEKSMQTLAMMGFNTDLEKQAKMELMASFAKSLANMEEADALGKEGIVEDIDGTYTRFTDDDGNFIKGIKLHAATDTLHLYGLVVNKRVIVPGTYSHKKETRRPLTIAKDKLRYLTPVGKFRQFKILASKLDGISVEKLTLLPTE